MASIVETKAVALRRGTHPENLAFTGVQGEAVIDLGIEDSAGNLGVDSNTTVRIHNGITKGGIPLARADLLNVSTQMLAEERTLVNDKNLAYADLSNLEKVSSESTRNKVVSTLHEYGLAIESDVDSELENKANKNMSNVDTVSLATSAGHSGENLAYANTSNINTADLVNPSYHTGTNGNKPLAYEDTTNVNTASLVDETKHPKDSTNGNKPLAYYDFSNTDTTYLASTTQRPEGMSGPVLAEVDLSNVDPGILYNIISGDVDLNTVERITYKDSTIDENNVIASHYPETRAVVQYISNKTNSSANTELTNVESWNMLYSTSDSQIFTPIVTLVESQSGFEVQEEYGTGIYLTDDPQDHIKAIPTQVDSSGTITELELNGNTGSIDLTSLNPFVITSGTNVNATFTITSTSNGNGTYKYAIGSITNGGTGFEEDEEFFVKSSVSNEYYKVIYQELMIMPTEIEDPISEQEAIGKITKATCYPNHCNTEITEQVVTITSSTNTIARFTLKTSQFSVTEGAGVAKIDFTNLGGMTATDQVVEQGSNWRIRHDEAIPSLSETTIPTKQDYTIATNGNVWRALKNNGNGIFEVTDNTTFNDITNAINSNKIVMMKQHDGTFVGLSHVDSTKYTFDHIYDNTHITYTIDSNDHTSSYGRALWYGGVRLYLDYRQIQSLNPTVELRLSESENMKVNKYAEDAQFGEDVYILYPSQSYIYYIDHDDTTIPETYEFTPTSNDAPFIRQRLKKLEIKFNINVSNAQIDFYSATGGTHITDTISGTSKTINRVLNTAWTISKPGYSSQSGVIDVLQESNPRIVINVTLDEES